jgi:glycosyltransferase involved in cell wall biosynthesis
MGRIYKADLHLHSRHSNKPSYWALRKFNCPESFTDPNSIYHTALKRGMDYVTITDHNSINGSLEIAHLPRAFISAEVTARFPENGCKVHVVVLNITEMQFLEIDHLRQNVYDMVDYLESEGIAHFVAHAFYDLNGKLTPDIFEKLVLLFKVFEVKNGARSEHYNTLLEEIVCTLTREKILELADRHDVSPRGERPWIKGMAGGSDDHGGLFIGRAYTVSRRGDSLESFLDSLVERETWAGGSDGNSLILAHSIYSIAYRFFQGRGAGRGESYPFLRALASRITGEAREKLSLRERVKLFLRSTRSRLRPLRDGASLEETLDFEAGQLLTDSDFQRRITSETTNRLIFKVTSRLANRMLYLYTDRLVRQFRDSGIVGLFHSLSTIAFTHLFVSPYYIAYRAQHQSKEVAEKVRNTFMGGQRREKVALFTDTLNEINGVAITIRRILETARTKGLEFQVVTCTEGEALDMEGVVNFNPVGSFSLPEYPDLKMNFPPLLDLMQHVEREGITRIHISTPGTVGLAGLLVSKLMSIPVSGTYHTDIPRYVQKLTDDSFMEDAAWSFMIWFYGQMDEVTVPSSSTRRQLVERGLDGSRIKPLPRWVDTHLFHPSRRDCTLRQRLGGGGSTIFLYVGRISREKNLPLLAQAFKNLAGRSCRLVLVGDGPYREEMEEALRDYPALFTGFKSGQELLQLYASADVFVFPSATDTFGNVVLEAQASGLPVIVTDEGGPHEIMIPGETGIMVKAGSVPALAEAMSAFLDEPEKIRELGRRAREYTQSNRVDGEDSYSTILRMRHDEEGAACRPDAVPTP